MECLSCSCSHGCVPVSISYLKLVTGISDLSYNNYADLFELANMYLEEHILGDCIYNLCSHIKEAEQKALDQDGVLENWLDYVDEPWKQLFVNGKVKTVFQRLYWLILEYQGLHHQLFNTKMEGGQRVSTLPAISDGGAANISGSRASTMAIRKLPLLQNQIQLFCQCFLIPNRYLLGCCPPALNGSNNNIGMSLASANPKHQNPRNYRRIR